MGNYAEASDYIAKATKLYSQLILNTFSDLTGNERTLFWNKYNWWFEVNIPECTYYIQNDSLTATAYDGALLSKGLLLNSEMEMNKLLLESGDAAVVSKYQALQMNRMMLNKLYEKPITERTMSTDSLEKVIQARERELVQLFKVYGDYTKNLSINWKQVQEKLSDKDVAIEFLNFGAMNDSVMYVALTLTKDDDVPHLVPLFEKKELDGIDKRDYYNTSKLSELIWKPLTEALEGKENVYFAPAGELHNIAIESIPFYDGDGLMSDHCNLYRVSSTRELALTKDKYGLREAYVYGDLTYAMSVDDMAANAEKYDKAKRDVDWEVLNIADSLDLRGAFQKVLKPLTATKKEVENIDNALNSRDIHSTLLTDTMGTETSVKALAGSKPNLLHIATHGFYWTESDVRRMSNALSSLSMFNNDVGQKYEEDKALTRSGLFFAGAENAFSPNKVPDNVDDGILTAKEISVLDLRGLDLVVLSACETGLGEITGDGVFGLQRGFKKAGANTLVMSLWKVDDDATELLMSQFYNNLVSGEMSKTESLKQAQAYVREYEKDGNHPYSDPFFWAAFIMLDGIR